MANTRKIEPKVMREIEEYLEQVDVSRPVDSAPSTAEPHAAADAEAAAAEAAMLGVPD